jgi:hypothetical protein
MKPQNIIIAITFLLVVSIFSFNFEEITGFQVKTLQPYVFIENDVVTAGQPIKIKVQINDACIDPTFEFYYKGLRKDTRTYKPTEDDCAGQDYTCKGSKYCRGDLENDRAIYDYYTLPSWKLSPGLYNVRVHYMEKAGQSRYKTPYVERTFRIL